MRLRIAGSAILVPGSAGIILSPAGCGYGRAHRDIDRSPAQSIPAPALSLQAGGAGRHHSSHLGGDRPGHRPTGIELAPDGTLSGTPTEVDSFRFIVTVTDSGKPAAQKKKEFILPAVAPLVVEWSRKPKVTGHRLEAAIRVSNQTGDDFDFTVIALAVNEYGRATAVGYQHFTLNKDTDEFEIPFAENLPRGAYDVHVDAVGEVVSTDSIFRGPVRAPTENRR